ARRDLLLSSAGALLMPSLYAEAFGMAGIEALAQGTPGVAYDVGGISEWCHAGAGGLVPFGDIWQAARAVRGLTEDAVSWAKHSRAASRVAELEFPSVRFARELDEILTRILTPRNREWVLTSLGAR